MHRFLGSMWAVVLLVIAMMALGCGSESTNVATAGDGGFGDACTRDAQCRPELVCVGSRAGTICSSPCESDLQCPGGSACELTDQGVHCVPSPSADDVSDAGPDSANSPDTDEGDLGALGDPCVDSADCGGTLLCATPAVGPRICATGCVVDSHCTGTDICLPQLDGKGYCGQQPSDPNGCSPACGSSQTCVAGACREAGTTCTRLDAPCTGPSQDGRDLACVRVEPGDEWRCRPGCLATRDCSRGEVCQAPSEGASLICQPRQCPAAVPGHLGVRVTKANEGPLLAGQTIDVTVEVMADAASAAPVWVVLDHANLDLDPQSLRRDGRALTEAVSTQGDTLTIAQSHLQGGTYTYTATVRSSSELLMVLGRLELTDFGCTNPRSGAGTMLQVLGGVSKTAECIDLSLYRSLQVALEVPMHSTQEYLDENGAREDLIAGDFIFCPQSPTVVHAAEFCGILPDSHTAVTLAGHYDRSATWEVDDFLLFEIFRGQELLDDGVTTQQHPGGDTFWCPEIQELMCEDGCTASLTVAADDRTIEPVAVASAVGPEARRQDDGTVEITSLLPADGLPFQIRVSALDVGVQGTITPDLFLVTDIQ